MTTLCGARIWVDWRPGRELKDRLWEYVGQSVYQGVPNYTFLPYKREGLPAMIPYATLLAGNYPLKPFLIDTKAMERIHNGDN